MARSEVLTMVQKIRNASIFGRVGSGIGQGLAEQIPKEVELYRLAQGLQALEKDAPNLSPSQRFSRALTVPGLIDRPQAIQSLGELYRQEGVSNSLMNRPKGINIPNGGQPTPTNTPVQPNQPTPSQDKVRPNEPGQPSKKRPSSLTTVETEQAALNPVMPWTPEQEKQRAGELLDQDRGYYQGNYQKALDDAKSENAYRVSENQIKVAQHGAQTAGTKLIDDELQKRATSLGVNIPGMNVEGKIQIPAKPYNEIREKAVEAVKNGKMTAADAAIEAGKELDKVSRQYQNVKNIGKFVPLWESAKDVRKSFKDLRKKFADRDDREGLAEAFVAYNGLSYDKAYYEAYNPEDFPKLDKDLKALPWRRPEKGSFPFNKITLPLSKEKANEVYGKIFKSMGTDASPLAVKQVLQLKGYDGNAWIDYCREHERELTGIQKEQLPKSSIRNIPTNGDFWLYSMLEMDNLLEY